MNQELIDLAVERGRLIERISNQRQQVEREWRPVGDALRTADYAVARIRQGGDYVKEHPEVVAIGVAVLVVVKPRRVWRWSKRAYVVWRTWRTLRRQMTELGLLARRPA